MKKILLNACTEAIKKQSFYTPYYNTFDVVRADTDWLRERAFRLRHKVFCQENGFDNQSGLEDIEHDSYDEHAVHFVLIHKISKEIAGTVRVIIPQENNLSNSFPMQESCTSPLLAQENNALQMVEISRLSMARCFRRRESDGSILPAYSQPDIQGVKDLSQSVIYMRRRIPYAPLGLIRAAFEVALETDRLGCVYAASQNDIPSLHTAGFDFQTIDTPLKESTDLQPVIFNIKHVLDHMASANPTCWEMLSDKGRLHEKANDLAKNKWYGQFLKQEQQGDPARNVG